LANYLIYLEWRYHVENDSNSEFAFESSDDDDDDDDVDTTTTETRARSSTNHSLYVYCPFLGYEKQGQGAQVQRHNVQK
jgi:hypothetical protein